MQPTNNLEQLWHLTVLSFLFVCLPLETVPGCPRNPRVSDGDEKVDFAAREGEAGFVGHKSVCWYLISLGSLCHDGIDLLERCRSWRILILRSRLLKGEMARLPSVGLWSSLSVGGLCLNFNNTMIFRRSRQYSNTNRNSPAFIFSYNIMMKYGRLHRLCEEDLSQDQLDPI